MVLIRNKDDINKDIESLRFSFLLKITYMNEKQYFIDLL